jgi:hypothetical protein
MNKQTKTIRSRRSLSLEELAAEQGVSPVEDLDEVAKLWPANDDPDLLLQYVLTERAERRRLTDHSE